MSTAQHPTVRRQAAFATRAALILFGLGIIPVAALFAVGPIMSRDCRVERAVDGEAGPSMVWRIEVQRCGGGPLVTNVLLAPRGKSLALVASATGAPLPTGVVREADGRTLLLLDRPAADGATARLLALKATGRPAKPMVLADGVPKS